MTSCHNSHNDDTWIALSRYVAEQIHEAPHITSPPPTVVHEHNVTKGYPVLFCVSVDVGDLAISFRNLATLWFKNLTEYLC